METVDYTGSMRSCHENSDHVGGLSNSDISLEECEASIGEYDKYVDDFGQGSPKESCQSCDSLLSFSTGVDSGLSCERRLHEKRNNLNNVSRCETSVSENQNKIITVPFYRNCTVFKAAHYTSLFGIARYFSCSTITTQPPMFKLVSIFLLAILFTYSFHDTFALFLRYTLLLKLYIMLFAALFLFVFLSGTGLYNISGTPAQVKGPNNLMYFNGSDYFAKTTILISLDGFRADFVHEDTTPNLYYLWKNSISPEYMQPSFPSVTFANHYTLVTGLYPESHGIVSNNFWDPDHAELFYYRNKSSSMQAKWWGGDPLWVLAERHKVKTAINMWPGSEARIQGIDPSFLQAYSSREELSTKVRNILTYLDMPGLSKKGEYLRPQLIASYVPNVDHDGHLYGPESVQTQATVQKVDRMIGNLYDGLVRRNLTNHVNMIIVSDHGMASSSNNRLVQLEDLVDPKRIAYFDGWPLFGLWPRQTESITRLERDVRKTTRKFPNVKVYNRDKDMPRRFHFRHNRRIAPLWLIPRTGWAIVDKATFNVKKHAHVKYFAPRGLHGYDFEHPLMRAIFIAHGPAFTSPHGFRFRPFRNVNAYNLICDSLSLPPSPNNGTMRLDLHTGRRHTLLRSSKLLHSNQ